MFLVFDWWLDVIWLKSHRNVTYCIDFNIVIRILNTPVSAKMAQGQRKWRAVVRSLNVGDLFVYPTNRVVGDIGMVLSILSIHLFFCLFIPLSVPPSNLRFPHICMQIAYWIVLKFGRLTQYGTLQAQLTFGNVPLNSHYFLASDWLISVSTYVDRMHIRLSSDLLGEFIMGLSTPN